MPIAVGSKDKKRCTLCYDRTQQIKWATVKCRTCDAFLCLMPDRNCFVPWHTHGDGEVQQLDETRVDLDASGRYESGDVGTAA